MARRPKHPSSTLPLALIALAALAGCRGERPGEPVGAAPEPRTGGTAVVAAAADISGVNPLLDHDSTFNQELLDALFLRLFEEQPDFAQHPPTFAPSLAADWRWSEDGRSLLVELRPGLVWSDGAPLTAEDVVWTWQLQRHPAVGWSYAEATASITAEAVGARHVRFHFGEPSSTPLADLNLGAVLPRHRWQQLPPERWTESGGWFVDNLVVSGPFRLAAWRRDQEIVIEPNPRYYREGLPRLDRVVFRIVPEDNARLNQLLGGAVDFVADVQPAAAARIDAHPATRLEGTWDRQYNYIFWNLGRPQFADIRARQALTMAIDRQAMVDTLWFGYARIASSPILSSVWAHRHGDGPWPHDPRRAAAQLAALGWRAGEDGVLVRGGERFSLELLTNAESQPRVNAAVMVQENLRRIGIEARVRQQEFNTVIGRSLAHDFDALLFAFDIDTSLDLGYAFHSRSISEQYNFGGYSNPEVDELIERARATSDPADKGQLLDRIQEILHEEQPLTFLWESQQLNGSSRRLHGVRPNALSSLFRLDEWWLAAPVGGAG